MIDEVIEDKDKIDLSRLSHWRKKPVSQLLIAPTILSIMLFGLIGLNHNIIDQPIPTPPPNFQPNVTVVSEPILEKEEIVMATKYQGNTINMIVDYRDLFRGDLVLVNQTHKLPDDYLAEDLTDMKKILEQANLEYFTVSKANLMLNETVAENLLQLIIGANNEGIVGYSLVSGHRELAYQVYLFERKTKQYMELGYELEAAKEKAKQIVAIPGQSEHHTGLALDLPSINHPKLETSYVDTSNGTWLKENVWNYGFVIRYPKEKQDITGISYEPWHLRYVGKPHSEIMQRENWCLEEYIDILKINGGYTTRLADGTVWQIDYCIAQDGLINIPVDKNYNLSGDGKDGFIISIKLD